MQINDCNNAIRITPRKNRLERSSRVRNGGYFSVAAAEEPESEEKRKKWYGSPPKPVKEADKKWRREEPSF